eukprot:329819_1
MVTNASPDISMHSLQSTMNYTIFSPNALHNSPQVTTDSHTSYEHNQHMYVPWTPLFDGNLSEIPFAQSDIDTHELDMPDFDDNLSELSFKLAAEVIDLPRKDSELHVIKMILSLPKRKRMYDPKATANETKRKIELMSKRLETMAAVKGATDAQLMGCKAQIDAVTNPQSVTTLKKLYCTKKHAREGRVGNVVSNIVSNQRFMRRMIEIIWMIRSMRSG